METESESEGTSKRSKVMKGWWKEWVKSCLGWSLFKCPRFHQSNYWRHLTAFILKWLSSFWSSEGGGMQGGASLCRTFGAMEAVLKLHQSEGWIEDKKKQGNDPTWLVTGWNRSKDLWHRFKSLITAMEKFYCSTRMCLIIHTKLISQSISKYLYLKEINILKE